MSKILCIFVFKRKYRRLSMSSCQNPPSVLEEKKGNSDRVCQLNDVT